MKHFLTTTLLASLFTLVFQNCEKEPTSSGIGPLYVVEVTPSAVNIEIDSTQQFTAVGKDVDMNVIPDLTFNWTSDNTNIATIEEDGLVTGVGVGSTTITASLREVESLPATVTIKMILPSVTTADISDITYSSAVGGGTVIHNGGGDISSIGICWSNTDPPTIYDNVSTTAVDTGSFTVNLDGLIAETTYYVRAYATNEKGTGYGDVMSFTSNALPPALPVTDIDGNTYQTVQIGNQVWMAENLRVTHYRNGDTIATGYTNSEWSNLPTGAYAVYNDNESNAEPYGYLYNWYAVDDNRNIAPAGWHVPTDAEWQTLVDYLGGSSVAGGKLKEAGTSHWNSPNTGASNESGFTALPGGGRTYADGYYGYMGSIAFFWSATENFSNTAWNRRLEYGQSVIGREDVHKRYGFSIRCVRD